jgi:hypothetical protein
MLDCAKETIDPNLHKGVYTILSSWNNNYIAETGRSLQTRIKEHCADIKYNCVKRSALANYQDTFYLIWIDNTKIIVKLTTTIKIRFRKPLKLWLMKTTLIEMRALK